jgi:transposase
VKTDTRDADALFEANRLGIYRPAHRRSDARQDVIEMLATRDSLVRTRTRWTSHIRAMLRRRGWRVPSGSPEKIFDRIGAMGLAREATSPLEAYRAVWSKLNEQIEELERRLEQVTEGDAEMRLVQTAPAFGVVTSAAVVAVIDDPRRFRKAHQVESYVGLVPAEWSSSEQRRRGRITKRGDTRTRWLFVEAAQRVLRSRRPECGELRRWAQSIAARRGKKVATVALARRLAGIVWAMLRTGKAFDPSKLNHGLRVAA